MIIISFSAGCVTLGGKYTEPGRHYWNQRDPLVEHEQELKEIIQSCKIKVDIKIAVMNNNSQTAEDVEEIFHNYGFKILQEEYEDNADYIIEVKREDRKDKHSGFYGYGYSNNDERVSGVKLIVFDRDGTKRYYSSLGEYKYGRSYWGWYYHNYSYLTDPGRMATKIAAAIAVANLIDGENILHYWPTKK